MRKLPWFLAGSVFVIALEIMGAWAVSQALPEPVAVTAPPVYEHRMIFKMLAPKGFEDSGYVQLDCKPMLHKTKLLNGRK